MVALLPCRCRLDASVASCGGTVWVRPFLWSGHVSDPGLGSSGASLISTPGSGSGCDSCSGSESGSGSLSGSGPVFGLDSGSPGSGSVGNLGSMLMSVVNMAMRTPSPRCLTIGASQWQLSIRPPASATRLWGVALAVA